MKQDAKSEIITGGGAYARGNVRTAGGDFVGRDQYNQFVQLDITKMAEALRQALPSNDPAPDLWVNALKEFQLHHTRLCEWKELHNFLNDILVTLGQFKREVERIDISGEKPDTRVLSRLWRPVVQKADAMMDWSTTIKYITDKPLMYSEDHTEGPSWAIDLYVSKILVDGLLDRQVVETDDIYDAVFDFSDVVEQHLYLVDKMLRSAAGELYNLSRIVLGKMEHE